MMKAAIVPNSGGKLEIVEKPIPTPGKGWVRIKVYCCGVCHTDVFLSTQYPMTPFPCVLGHEVAGVVDQVGEDVSKFKIGDRVGVGLFGGCCHDCRQCDRGSWTTCQQTKRTSLHMDGGMAEYMVAPVDALVIIPDGIPFAEAAPLMCGGVTPFLNLRDAGLKAGEMVVVHGIGGLGHLAIQYAKKMGYIVVAVSSSNDKEKLAKELGADYFFIGSEETNQKIQSMGGAKVVLLTAPSQSASELIQGALSPNGSSILLTLLPELKINPIQMIISSQTISGRYCGDSRDISDCLQFTLKSNIHPIIETYSLDQVNHCFENINNARFRSVLVIRNE